MKKAIITTIILSVGIIASSSVKLTQQKQIKLSTASISNNTASGKEIASAD